MGPNPQSLCEVYPNRTLRVVSRAVHRPAQLPGRPLDDQVASTLAKWRTIKALVTTVQRLKAVMMRIIATTR
jgi:hypothetical protein